MFYFIFRAIAPRSNMTMNAVNNQATVQRTNANQSSQPQLIVLDGDKTPNMSNTARLSHFPTSVMNTLAANPALQIQPAANNNTYSSKFKNNCYFSDFFSLYRT